MAITFQIQINGAAPVSFNSLGLDLPRIAGANMQPDMAEVAQPGVQWDSAPVLAYRDDVTIWKTEGLTSVRVFRGLRRLAPRFLGATAESITYTLEGPWGWLQRRPLMQVAAVPPLEGDGPPSPVPQGLVILGQDDGGITVNLAQALATIINAAIAAGVPITLGVITGFDFQSGWDWMRDVTIADAITRLLQVAPDAVCDWDYSTLNPTINIRRRPFLTAVSLAVAPKGTVTTAFGPTGYAEFETVKITDRPDLAIPGCWLTFRSINTTNGTPSLKITSQSVQLEGALPTDENALVRTVELAGSVLTTNNVYQDCTSALLPPMPAAGEELTTGAALDKMVSFIVRGGALDVSNPFRYPTKLVSLGHIATPIADEDGVESTPALDTSLTRELLTGGITDWMELTGLNRKGQAQQISFKVTHPEGEAIVSRQFMATNVVNRRYDFEESSDLKPPEPQPFGLAAALFDSMSGIQHEGQFTLAQHECTFAIRIGQAINLTGTARPEWATMMAVVQTVSYDLVRGRTNVTLGFNRALGAGDLVAIWRSNRSRQPAERGLIRATGRF